MTCDTENKDLEQAYFRYLEEIAENVKSCDQRLKTKFFTISWAGMLPETLCRSGALFSK